MPTLSSVEKLAPAGNTRSSATANRFSSTWTYSATFATEFSVMLAQIAVYKLAAHWMGQIGFSEYALARRVLALLQPLIMLGLGVAIPRYIALAAGRGESFRATQYLAAAVTCVASVTVPLVVVLVAWPRWCSYVLFGAPEHASLLAPVAVMLVGISAHSILYAVFRGKLAMARANVLQLINNCLIPVAVFICFHKDAASLLRWLGFAWIIFSAIMFLITPLQARWQNPLKESKELLMFGLQRVPGDFAMTALMALPAIFVAHLAGIKQAGFVAFGLSIVNMVASFFIPIGIILLPQVSRAIGSGDFDGIRHEIVVIRRLTLLLAGSLVILVELFAGALIKIYLGPEYSPAAAIVKVVMLGALPLAFFSALRSAIDAIYQRAINTLNLLPTLLLFLAGAGAGVLRGSYQFVLWSFSAALALLALLTQREVHKILSGLRGGIHSVAATAVGESPEGSV
jgi:O-antigen/teichoic acid export membrane protein